MGPQSRGPSIPEVTMNIYARVALQLFVTALVIAVAETERAYAEGRLKLPWFLTGKKRKQLAAAE